MYIKIIFRIIVFKYKIMWKMVYGYVVSVGILLDIV